MPLYCIGYTVADNWILRSIDLLKFIPQSNTGLENYDVATTSFGPNLGHIAVLWLGPQGVCPPAVGVRITRLHHICSYWVSHASLWVRAIRPEVIFANTPSPALLTVADPSCEVQTGVGVQSPSRRVYTQTWYLIGDVHRILSQSRIVSNAMVLCVGYRVLW